MLKQYPNNIALPPIIDKEFPTEPSAIHQLETQIAIYNFFGTQPLEIIKRYIKFVPKGSIFFHGDNISQPLILFSKLLLVEKIVSVDETGIDVYTYKINPVTVSLDSPVIKIRTQIEGTEQFIENIVTQTSALL
jgi:hypothetical protein